MGQDDFVANRVEPIVSRAPRVAGFENRAAGIARLVGDNLARRPPRNSVTVTSASVGPLTVALHASDRQIAATIAASIWREVGA